MKAQKLLLISLLSIFSIFTLAGCDPKSGNLPDNEVTSILTDFAKATDADLSDIKESSFEWYNPAQNDPMQYSEDGYYTINGYGLAISGVKDFPNMQRIMDGWHVFYMGDEIGGSAIQYSKDNVVCDYFLSLEQELPYELMTREGDYDNPEELAAYDQAWADFYEIASYSVELSCGYAPEGVLQFKDFNYYAEGMEPFWNSSFRGDIVNIFTPDGVEDAYIETLQSQGDDIIFKGYNIEGKLEKSECIDGGKGDIHEYNISFDIKRTIYSDDGTEYDQKVTHYEGCADSIDAEFVIGEEGSLNNLIKKTGYKYTKDFDKDDVSYAISNIAGRYMNLNIYASSGTDYESYQVLMERTDNGWNTLYEGEGYEISDEKCEELNQYDNSLMDLFFLKSCPRG